MFGLLKKEMAIRAIADGKLIPLEEVNDQVFANKMMGNGIGFSFHGNRIYAPCDGRIIMIASTKHAIGVKTKHGAELMIHLGMDTVNLNGKGLEILVSENETVQVGQPLIQVDLPFMIEHDIDLTTPVIMINSEHHELEIVQNQGDIKLGNIVMKIKKH